MQYRFQQTIQNKDKIMEKAIAPRSKTTKSEPVDRINIWLPLKIKMAYKAYTASLNSSMQSDLMAYIEETLAKNRPK